MGILLYVHDCLAIHLYNYGGVSLVPRPSYFARVDWGWVYSRIWTIFVWDLFLHWYGQPLCYGVIARHQHTAATSLDYSVNQQQVCSFEYCKILAHSIHVLDTHDKPQVCSPTERPGVVSSLISLIVESGVCCCSSPGDMYIIHDLI